MEPALLPGVVLVYPWGLSVFGVLFLALQFGLISFGFQRCLKGCKFAVKSHFGKDWYRQWVVLLTGLFFSDCRSPACLVIFGLTLPGFGTPWQYGHYKSLNFEKVAMNASIFSQRYI